MVGAEWPTCKTENAERSNNFVVKISNTSLPQVEHTKFLSVIIDEKLTWRLAASLKLISENCPAAQED